MNEAMSVWLRFRCVAARQRAHRRGRPYLESLAAGSEPSCTTIASSARAQVIFSDERNVA